MGGKKPKIEGKGNNRKNGEFCYKRTPNTFTLTD